MRFILLLTSLLFVVSVSKAQKTDTLKMYDFWLGKWNLSWDEGDGKTGTATNHITKIMNDAVIQENFEILNRLIFDFYFALEKSVCNNVPPFSSH